MYGHKGAKGLVAFYIQLRKRKLLTKILKNVNYTAYAEPINHLKKLYEILEPHANYMR